MARRLIWIYCILWVFEGALRKWVIPSLSMPLLIIRDPVVLGIYWYAARARVFPANSWLGIFGIICALVGIQGLMHAMAGDVAWSVAVFGIRTFALHLPLIWVVPQVMRREDIIKLGKWMLLLAMPMALLMVVQFRVGPDHWLNVASLKGGSQIGSVFGRIRPPAVFSFISGPIHYFTLCTAFAIAGFLVKDLFPRWLVITGLLAAMIAASVSASRSLVLGCAVVVLCGGIAGLRSGKAAAGVGVLAMVLIAAIFGLSRFSTLKEGISAFQERWSSEEEGGAGSSVVVKRYGGGFVSSLYWAGRVPLQGHGVGITSNLAVERSAYVAPVEGEWERVIYEVGPFTGYMYLFFRAALAISVIVTGFHALRTGNLVCVLIASACFLDMLNNNFRQVTTYGYVAMTCGLAFAAVKAFAPGGEESVEEAGGPDGEAEPPVEDRPRIRGRAPFAVGGAPVQP